MAKTLLCARETVNSEQTVCIRQKTECNSIVKVHPWEKCLNKAINNYWSLYKRSKLNYKTRNESSFLPQVPSNQRKHS